MLKKQTGADGLYYKGNLAGSCVVMTVSGIGKVNAAHAATRLILDHAPAQIWNIGIGGAYPSSGLGIGDIAVAEREIYGDEGVLQKEGLTGLSLLGIPLLKKGRKKYFNEFILDRKLMQKAAGLRSPEMPSFRVKSGPFVTVSACTGTVARAREIEERFHAVCENMEGAAIAHICTRYDVPMVEMRGISNIVEDRDRARWNIRLAADNCQQAAQNLLRIV
jgi:futalosine hydrolase